MCITKRKVTQSRTNLKFEYILSLSSFRKGNLHFYIYKFHSISWVKMIHIQTVPLRGLTHSHHNAINYNITSSRVYNRLMHIASQQLYFCTTGEEMALVAHLEQVWRIIKSEKQLNFKYLHIFTGVIYKF